MTGENFMDVNKTKILREELKMDEFPSSGSLNEKLLFLVKYAMLAPSSHNTQPWKFIINGSTITVTADMSKWLNIADSDRRELYISIGCSVENLLLASDHYGMNYHVSYFPDKNNEDIAAVIAYDSNINEGKTFDPVFDEILMRATNRKGFESRPIEDNVMEILRESAVDDLKIFFTSDKEKIERISELVKEADKIEFANPEFRKELAKWLGRGAFGSGKLVSTFSKFVVEHVNIGKMMARSDSRLILSSPVFSIIYTDSSRNDRLSQLMTGRTFERVYLISTMLGISLQPMSQLMQVGEIKRKVSDILSLGDKVLLQPFRLGYAQPVNASSPRDPVDDIVKEEGTSQKSEK